MSTTEMVRVSAELRELIPGFLANRRDDVHRIADALRHSDLDTVRRIGHSLKGVGGGYGFDRITEYGRELEDAAIARDHERARAALEKYAAHVMGVQVEYV